MRVLADVKLGEARTVDFLSENALELSLEHPRGNLCNILLHHRGGSADHPAVLGAGADLLAHLLGLFAEPDFLKVLCVVDIAHTFLPVTRLQTVAGVNFAPRVSKEVHGTRFAREHSLAALDVLDKAQVEEGTEPGLRMVLLQQAVNQLADIVAEFFLVADLVVFLMEVVAIVEGRRRKFKIHREGKFVKRNQVVAVPIAERLAKADILYAHFMQGLQRTHAAFKAVVTSTQEVIGAFKAFNTHTDADIRKTFCKLDDAVHPPAARTDHDTGGLGEQHFHDVFQVLADKGFAAGHICKLELRKDFQILRLNFFTFLGRVLPDVAHLAAHLATVSCNHRHVCRHLNLRITMATIRARHKTSTSLLFNPKTTPIIIAI